MKTPKFLSKLSAVLTPRPKKKLQATARAARQVMEDYESEEPTTKLSSAFIVVLILHVVAVGGIYAFNSIKASRRDHAAVDKPAEMAASAAARPVAKTHEENTVAAANPAAASRKVEAASTAPTAPPPAALTAVRTGAGKQYEVKSGDNLTKIAFAYSISSADLAAANQIKDGAVLRPGQLLTIPPAKTAARPATEAAKPTTAAKQQDVPPTKTTPGLYTVKKGDTLTSIAKSFGLTLEEISKANKITDPKKLQLGQVLKVPRKS